jgi:hypothetical protein
MLVIADYNTKTGEKVELKDLEKYGFKWCYQYSKDGDIPSKKYYMRYDYTIYIMRENKTYKIKDKAVKLNSASYESTSLLYHLIEKGLITDVKDRRNYEED